MSAGAGAAAAAAAAARRRAQEEEEMATYNPGDLADNWEFKILRSMTGAFKDQARLNEVLEQERRAGWELVEKFDNNRIRLKRPAAARKSDQSLEFDPYRTYVGPSETRFTLTIIAVVFGIMFAIVAVMMLIAAAVS
jgi:hypothetical protein